MKTIHINVSLRPMDNRRKRYHADFGINSGSMNSIAPASALKEAGIEPIGNMTCEMPDGTLVEYAFAVAVIEFMGEITAGRVIFGPEGTEPLVGVTALQSVGIVVDPRNQKLNRLPAISLK
jgi:predicted aspartyl protease